jgi:hypothetical protein
MGCDRLDEIVRCQRAVHATVGRCNGPDVGDPVGWLEVKGRYWEGGGGECRSYSSQEFSTIHSGLRRLGLYWSVSKTEQVRWNAKMSGKLFEKSKVVGMAFAAFKTRDVTLRKPARGGGLCLCFPPGAPGLSGRAPFTL